LAQAEPIPAVFGRSSLGDLEEKLGYRFQNRKLLLRALTHRSWLSDRSPIIAENADNEQLEFLGDAILGFVVSEALMLRHRAESEGRLSKWKSQLVSAAHLYQCALLIGLGEHLLLGKGEEHNGGRGRRTLLANAFEAIIAAIHLDGGIEAARTMVRQRVLDVLPEPGNAESVDILNFKGTLLERTQELGLPEPRYNTVASSGPEHAKVFTVAVQVGDRFSAQGQGTSKKAASQYAAQALMKALENEEAGSPTLNETGKR
jgi:ribonuclease-3